MIGSNFGLPFSLIPQSTVRCSKKGSFSGEPCRDDNMPNERIHGVKVTRCGRSRSCALGWVDKSRNGYERVTQCLTEPPNRRTASSSSNPSIWTVRRMIHRFVTPCTRRMSGVRQRRIN